MSSELKNDNVSVEVAEALKKSNTISKTFCHFPFTTSFIGSGGIAIPCCVSELANHPDSNKELQLPRKSFNDYWNSKVLAKVRQELLEGKKPISCRRCWVDEAQGMTSKRIDDATKIERASLEDLSVEEFKEKIIKKPKLLWLDLQMANLCNLGCRMCTPWNSSIIEDEAIAHAEEFKNQKMLKKRILDPLPYVAKETAWWKDSGFRKELEKLIPQLRAITVSGGEPTVNKYFNDIIDFCIKEGYAKDLILKFNTNGMQINRKYMDKLTPFYKIEMKVSVDAVGPLYGYIRWKGDWKTLEKNMFLFKEYRSDRFKVVSDPTYMVLNILNMVDLLQWHLDNDMWWYNLNPVHLPKYHNITCLPMQVRELAYNRLSKFLQTNKSVLDDQQRTSITNILLHLETDDIKFQKEILPIFFEHTKILDKLRGQSFSELAPELYNLLHKTPLLAEVK